MKLFLPKQHGAWAMLLVPYWLGVIESGFRWMHVPLFIGWLFLYLATYPFLMLFKKKKIHFHAKWSMLYLIPSILFLSVPLYHKPEMSYLGMIMTPFFGINVYFSSKNNDRAFVNDLSAIIVFCIAGIGSSFLVHGNLTNGMWLLFSSSVLFFIGSTFYVKSMIREKKNQKFKWQSWVYHLLVPIIWILAHEDLVALAFLPSTIRAFAFYGRPLSAKQVGVFEIVNSFIFFITMMYSLY
ncbi:MULTISPECIES: YwiC-like family protein [unclassified Bacillus (in: firmicutes)]|uniref:YwiC-like family protein n=1 Tax=unclassified Bacillus (in: firmicutes) TaxID=185979 RepID=UPI0008F1C278|nr:MULTISPECIES: YwiC-like family protein [unclassified Bacillus (in: firmicutes)]SFA78918.1 YwiC-like protein [Bacillus sp. UNCCL13]SFQ68856.1 YwiC-like protein [Bacillus sp. cl95]